MSMEWQNKFVFKSKDIRNHVTDSLVKYLEKGKEKYIFVNKFAKWLVICDLLVTGVISLMECNKKEMKMKEKIQEIPSIMRAALDWSRCKIKISNLVTTLFYLMVVKINFGLRNVYYYVTHLTYDV